jgi:hypothetical protein
MVQKATAQLMGLIGVTTSSLVLQAVNDGQHSPTGIGARVPSWQILMSIVQKVSAQFGLSGKRAPLVTLRVTSKQIIDLIFSGYTKL